MTKIATLLATKDHMNVFDGETLHAPALRTMLERIIANNRVGGWRKLKRES